MAIPCLIVDDEAPARALLQAYVARTPALTLVGLCKNGQQALDQLALHPVQLVFLDIQMPDMLGTDLARHLPPHTRVIFTTAYPQFAVEGFDLQATDYLLKPIPYPRFQQAVARALQWLQPAVATATSPPLLLSLKGDRRIDQVEAAAVHYIQSDSEYARYHTADKRYLVLDTLKRLATELPPDFLRVHRSYIVNMRHATALRGNRILLGRQEIPIGKNYRHIVERHFQSPMP
jgi:DNA-binding LytR/AlgR family response regulator